MNGPKDRSPSRHQWRRSAGTSQAVFLVDMRTYENLSGVGGAVGVPKMVFTQVDNIDEKRILGYVGTQGSLWYSFVDDEPASNKPGCFEMLPSDLAEIDTR